MPIPMLAVALVLLPLAGSPEPARAIQQAQAQAPANTPVASSAAGSWPVGVQLMTVVDHAATLAGQRVELPPARVRRVLAPTLVVIGDSRERGNYRSRRAYRWDRLLVLLPSGTAVPRGDRIVVLGTVRTVRGAQLAGELRGVNEDVVKRCGNATLLVAESVATPDGVSLGGRR